MSRNPIAGAAAAVLVLGAAALSSPATADVRVFACEPEWAALAKAIGGATSSSIPPRMADRTPTTSARVPA